MVGVALTLFDKNTKKIDEKQKTTAKISPLKGFLLISQSQRIKNKTSR